MDKQTPQPRNQPREIEQPAYVPDGYVLSMGQNGEPLVVPEFLIPATHQAFAAYHKRGELNVNDEAGGVSLISFLLFLSHRQVCLGRCRCRCRCRFRFIFQSVTFFSTNPVECRGRFRSHLLHRQVDSLTFW